jgi:hypothetical protein
MSDPFVYRSRDPQVTYAWKGAEAALHEYVKDTERVLEEMGLGGYKVYRDTHHWHPWHFAGLAIPQDEFPPDGWRMNAKYEAYAVPDKRTKAGKRAAAALAAVKHPGAPMAKVPGMPQDVCYPGGFTSPAVSLLEDGIALYVAWRIDPAGCRESFSSKSAEIDLALWERAPLSEYYAAKEARTEVAA